MTGWYEDKYTFKPEELQVIAPNTFMERKDIHQIDQYTWVCLERRISFDEYYMLQSIKEIKTDEAIDNYTMQLIEEGIL